MTSGGAESLLVDTNVLVYGNVAQAPLDQLARRTMEQYDAALHTLWISRQIVRDYLATVMRRSHRSWPVQTWPRAWRGVQ